jgi:hypothetical protein
MTNRTSRQEAGAIMSSPGQAKEFIAIRFKAQRHHDTPPTVSTPHSDPFAIPDFSSSSPFLKHLTVLHTLLPAKITSLNRSSPSHAHEIMQARKVNGRFQFQEITPHLVSIRRIWTLTRRNINFRVRRTTSLLVTIQCADTSLPLALTTRQSMKPNQTCSSTSLPSSPLRTNIWGVASAVLRFVTGRRQLKKAGCRGVNPTT